MHERIVDLRVAAEGRRRLSVSAAVALALGGLGTLAIATFSTPLAGVCAADDPPPPGGAPAAPAPAPAAPAKVRFPNDKERAELVPLFRSYLEGDSPDGFKFRIAMLGALKKLEASGVGILADIEKLKGLIYQARPFLPGYEKKNIPKEIAKETEVIFNSGTGVTNVKWGESRLSISLPPAYVAARDAKKLGTLPPFPMIVTLHTKDDYEDAKQQKPWAGEEAIKRLYPKTSMKAVTDAWIVYAPIYPKGKFTEDDAVRRDRVPLPPIFRRHHVDFDRIVIEGGIEAVLFAAAYPMYFAGVIVHGDTTDVPADSCRTSLDQRLRDADRRRGGAHRQEADRRRAPARATSIGPALRAARVARYRPSHRPQGVQVGRQGQERAPHRLLDQHRRPRRVGAGAHDRSRASSTRRRRPTRSGSPRRACAASRSSSTTS